MCDPLALKYLLKMYDYLTFLVFVYSYFQNRIIYVKSLIFTRLRPLVTLMFVHLVCPTEMIIMQLMLPTLPSQSIIAFVKSFRLLTTNLFNFVLEYILVLVHLA